MDTITCKCGCGQTRPRFDKKGRERLYISGHQNKEKSKAQIRAATATIKRIRPRIPWNKGKIYIHKSKNIYANKGSWNEAMRRIYPDACMRCGWKESTCDTHHIVSKSNGGQFSLENGIILCPNCHRLADFGVIGIDELKRIKQSIL